ncbi:MAG: ATP-binding protein [Candidatus Bathyarchaeota archaeon]|nr:ATP-binding protein [Candidatus Bathyarchaeota archaeon]
MSENRKVKPKKHIDEVDDREAASINSSPPCASALTKQRLEEILENVLSAIVVFESDNGKIVYANHQAVEIYGGNPCGITLVQLAEKLDIRFQNGKRCPAEELFAYRALMGQPSQGTLVTIARPDGRYFIVNVIVRPLFGEAGAVEYALVILLDVTDAVKAERALKESEKRLRMAQKIAQLGSWEYNIKEDRAVWSEELFRIFGLPIREFGPNFVEYFTYIHPDDRQKLKARLLKGSLLEPISFDYRIIRQDGAVRYIHTDQAVREYAQDGSPLRVMGIEQDITERKQIEDKLQQYAKNLEHLVDERTQQLKDAERLAAIGQTAGMIGHDIRNPLQAIVGELYLMSQTVDESAGGPCKQELQEGLGAIQEQIEYMNKIIADLQDFTRPLKPELSEVDLCKMLPHLVLTVKIPGNIEAFAKCDLELPKLRLDPTLLKRILVNLVTNAVQAMPNGGKLTLRATRQDGGVAITVQDTGVGIPDEVKPRIFQPLMTTKSKGQGFGLAVVKRLVEAQGGTISFESQAGVGTQFKIIFPKQLD